MPDPFLIGRRVYLRLFDESSCGSFVLRWWNHPLCRRHLSCAALPVTQTGELAELEPRGALRLCIALLEGDLPVGFVCLRGLDPFQRRAELFVLVAPDWQRRGLGREAASLLMDHAFGQLGLDLLGARFDQNHEAARHLAQRLGFEQVAALPRWNLRDGQRTDELVYALTRERVETLRAGRPNPWSN